MVTTRSGLDTSLVRVAEKRAKPAVPKVSRRTRQGKETAIVAAPPPPPEKVVDTSTTRTCKKKRGISGSGWISCSLLVGVVIRLLGGGGTLSSLTDRLNTAALVEAPPLALQHDVLPQIVVPNESMALAVIPKDPVQPWETLYTPWYVQAAQKVLADTWNNHTPVPVMLALPSAPHDQHATLPAQQLEGQGLKDLRTEMMTVTGNVSSNHHPWQIPMAPEQTFGEEESFVCPFHPPSFSEIMKKTFVRPLSP